MSKKNLVSDIELFHMECKQIYNDRNKIYDDVWKDYEIITNVDHGRGKLLRVLSITKRFYRDGISIVDILSAKDDLIDIANYCFFVYWKFDQMEKKMKQKNINKISDSNANID